MRGRTFKYILFLATISVTGVFLVQFAFLRSSYNLSEKRFKESTSVALKEVAWQILLAGGNTANFDSITPVEIISENCYLVDVGTVIDRELLKSHLSEQLKKHEIYADFEFAIYDQQSGKMEPGSLIMNNGQERNSCYAFPLNEAYIHYFGIHFPNRSSFFNPGLSIWYFFTGLLIVVLLFFGYTLSVIIRQRQLSEVQKNFINNLTHELKTPISSIELSAEVLKNKEILNSPERLKKYADIIQEQNKRLSKNVEKVLNLATIEKSKIQLNLKDIFLPDVLNEIIAQFKQSDFGQKAEITIHADKAQYTIEADKFHFSNLVINILENAVKYCDQSPVILIRLTVKKGILHLSFIDNGIGIPKDQRKKIFKKFYRIPTGNVHNVKGFGLGLDYVRIITNRHNWPIKVDENPEGGSIFTLSIPLKK